MIWKEKVNEIIELHKALTQVDLDNVWEYRDPNAGASEEELLSCERQLGFKLDAQHRRMLESANGWIGSFRSYDLLSTDELVAGPKLKRAQSILRARELHDFPYGCTQDQLLTVAASSTAIGLFLIAKPNSNCPGKVFWVAGEMLEEYDNFQACVEDMLGTMRGDYNKFVDRHGLDLPKYQ